MTLARTANRLFDRGDMAWFDLLAMSGRHLDAAMKRLPDEQIEAVLATRNFNQQLEQSL